MQTHRTGQVVSRGFYVGPWFDVQHVAADGEVLAGEANARYVKVPVLLVLAASPIAGGIFVLLFPLLALGALLVAMTQPVLWAARRLGSATTPMLRVRYEPAAAYLEEPRPDEAKADTPAGDELDDLRDEVAARRTDEDADQD